MHWHLLSTHIIPLTFILLTRKMWFREYLDISRYLKGRPCYPELFSFKWVGPMVHLEEVLNEGQNYLFGIAREIQVILAVTCLIPTLPPQTIFVFIDHAISVHLRSFCCWNTETFCTQWTSRPALKATVKFVFLSYPLSSIYLKQLTLL
jgi:hypothetical protein